MLSAGPWLTLFAAAVVLGRLTVPATASLALIWPAAGVGALWLLAARQRDRERRSGATMARVAAVGIAVSTVTLNAWTGAPLRSAVVFGVANVVQAAVLAAVLERCGAVARGRVVLRQPRDIGSALAAATAAACASAPLTALASPAADGAGHLLRSVGLVLTRNGTSALIVVVIVAALSSTPPVRRPRLMEAGICLLSSTVAYLVVFDPRVELPMTWLLVPFTVWAGARLGLRFTGLHVSWTASLAIAYTLADHGPFVTLGRPDLRAVSAQGFLAMLALLGAHLALVDQERWSALTAALRGQRSLRQLLESALVGNAVVALDGARHGVVDWANPAFCRLMRVAEPAGRALSELVALESAEDIAEVLQGLDRDGEWQGELRLRSRDGSISWVEVAAVRDPSDVARATVQLVDITARKDVEASLERLALHDALTGLPNRLLLRDSLQRMLDAARRSGTSVGVIFLDLDHFKRVNDAFGHAAGDDLLIEVGQRLRSAARAGDLVARISGDEFVVAAAELNSPAEARTLADRLLACFDAPFDVAGSSIRVTTSGGIALGAASSSPEELLDRSDGALYQVKRHGRGAIAASDDSLPQSLRELASIAEDIRHAVARDQLRVRYEPIVDTASGSVVGQEAVLDWHHPTLGVLSGRGHAAPSLHHPSHDSWLRLAQQAGVLEDVATLLLQRACSEATTWPTPRAVHVDVVSSQALTLDLLPLVTDALSSTGLEPRRLVLEFSESQVVANGEALVPVLRRLRELGVRVGVDHFGTASTRLAVLAQLPLDVVKLSADLVAGLDPSRSSGAPGARAVARGVIAAAQELQWEVVGTGVASAAALETLRQLGCRQAQGAACDGRTVPSQSRHSWDESALATTRPE
ncbi:MAG: putative bifunctional diguanylate cyclase/phosphodiesterase [Actinomycetes bacterium]